MEIDRDHEFRALAFVVCCYMRIVRKYYYCDRQLLLLLFVPRDKSLLKSCVREKERKCDLQS